MGDDIRDLIRDTIKDVATGEFSEELNSSLWEYESARTAESWAKARPELKVIEWPEDCAWPREGGLDVAVALTPHAHFEGGLQSRTFWISDLIRQQVYLLPTNNPTSQRYVARMAAAFRHMAEMCEMWSEGATDGERDEADGVGGEVG